MAIKRYITTVEEFLLLRGLGATIFDRTKDDHPINLNCHPDDMVENEKNGLLVSWVNNGDYYIFEE